MGIWPLFADWPSWVLLGSLLIGALIAVGATRDRISLAWRNYREMRGHDVGVR